MLGYKMAAIKMLHPFENVIFWQYLKKNIVLEANRLEPRSGPTFVGPDNGTSLFAIVQKYL